MRCHEVVVKAQAVFCIQERSLDNFLKIFITNVVKYSIVYMCIEIIFIYIHIYVTFHCTFIKYMYIKRVPRTRYARTMHVLCAVCAAIALNTQYVIIRFSVPYMPLDCTQRIPIAVLKKSYST